MWLWVSNQSQAGAALDAKAGTGRHGPRPQHQQATSAAQALSIPVKSAIVKANKIEREPSK